VTREGAKTVEALLQKTCVLYSGDLPSVTETEIAELQPQIRNWKMIEENRESSSTHRGIKETQLSSLSITCLIMGVVSLR
jgi:hypothetical protein